MHWLFDASEFLTRSHCGIGWTPNLITASRLFDFIIFVSYTSIPISLLMLWKGVRQCQALHQLVLENRWILLCFVLFIFFCGWTHLNDILVFEWPAYRYFIGVKGLTAAASLPTAILLPRIIARLLAGIGCDDDDVRSSQ